MSWLATLLSLSVCIAGSLFFSLAEISLVASRKIKLQQRAEEGDKRAEKVLMLQAAPGGFFTVVQMGLNTVAILGGMIGESSVTPLLQTAFSPFYSGPYLEEISGSLSFLIITTLFILLADLMPKRFAMTYPESIAVWVISPMLLLVAILRPLIFLINGMANILFRLMRISTVRKDELTVEDLFAMMEAGAEAGILERQEQEIIENVFQIQSLSVTSAMTARESVVYFLNDEGQESIQRKIEAHPYNKFLVCERSLDYVKGYVNTKEILLQGMRHQIITLKDSTLIQPVLTIPDTLSIYETMEYFKDHNGDFAVVVNEYALLVGIVTIHDLMSTITGEWTRQVVEAQIVQRDEGSWLVDGVTPISDVMRVLDIDEFPDSENYETMAGFIMYMLRKIPKRTDFVIYQGYKFEVVDIDSYKVD